MARPFDHEPVMAAEVAAILTGVPPGLVIDATIGGGGHAARLLASRRDLRVLGLDRDAQAIDAARERLERFGDRIAIVQSGYARLAEVVGEHMEHSTLSTGGRAPVTGVLFDLGVSSPQLDQAERGFSYRNDGPLDMRMDPRGGPTAADLVNEASAEELVRILRTYGEERHARSIGERIVAHRPLRRTSELVDAVLEAIPARARRRGRHPARRTFQALRIAVNDELGQLEQGLDAAVAMLAPGGRLAVLSYHSLEDRIVKRRFAEWTSGGHHPPGLPVRETARGGIVDPITRRPLRPSTEEVASNPRAQSARLRAVERREEPT